MKTLTMGDPILLHWPVPALHFQRTLLSFDIYLDTRIVRYPDYVTRETSVRVNHIDYCDVGTDTLFPDMATCIPGVYLAVYGDSTEKRESEDGAERLPTRIAPELWLWRGRAPTVLNLPVPALPLIF